MNVVVLSGRLTKKPELKNTTSTSVCNFSLAVDNGKVDESGKRGVDFIECVCFGKTAENLAKYQDKGGMLEIKGRIQVDTYTNNDNKKVSKTVIYSEMINYISSSKTQSSEPKNDQKDPFEEMGSKVAYDLPF